MKLKRKKILADCHTKINAIRQQSDAEKDDLNTRLRESFQMKWKNELTELKLSHQNEIAAIKQKFENMISVMEAEKSSLKEKLQRKPVESEAVQSLQLDLANHRQAWEEERLNFIENERTLNAKLADTLEVKKKLQEKVKRYHKYASSEKKKYLEKIEEYLKKIKEYKNQNEKLKKEITDKNNEFLTIKEQYELKVLKEEEDFKKKFDIRNSYCQTEEKLIPENKLINIHTMFVESLKKIADEMKYHLQDSSKRNAEQMKKALNFYRDSLFRDVLRDSGVLKQNYLNPHSIVNTNSGSSSRDRLVSNSSSTDNLAYHNTLAKNPFIPFDLNSANVLKHSTPDSGNKLGDMSFDYVPIKLPDSALTSTKIPEYFVPTGLFSRQNIS